MARARFQSITIANAGANVRALAGHLAVCTVVHLLYHLRRGLTSTFPVVLPGNCDPIPGKRSVWESGAPRGIFISSEARSWTTRSPLHLSERHEISRFRVHVCIAELYIRKGAPLWQERVMRHGG